MVWIFVWLWEYISIQKCLFSEIDFIASKTQKVNHEIEHDVEFPIFLFSREFILNPRNLDLLASGQDFGIECCIGWQFLRDFWISMSTKDEFTKQLFTKLLLIVKTSYVNIITFVMIYHTVYVQRNSHLGNYINHKQKIL